MQQKGKMISRVSTQTIKETKTETPDMMAVLYLAS